MPCLEQPILYTADLDNGPGNSGTSRFRGTLPFGRFLRNNLYLIRSFQSFEIVKCSAMFKLCVMYIIRFLIVLKHFDF